MDYAEMLWRGREVTQLLNDLMLAGHGTLGDVISSTVLWTQFICTWGHNCVIRLHGKGGCLCIMCGSS